MAKVFAGTALLFLLVAAAQAEDAPTPLPPAAAPLTAAKIVSGDELQLSDGRPVKFETVKLEGVKAPASGKLADQARENLEKLAGGKVLSLENGPTDRYGRTVAQIYAGEGKERIWLEGEQLKAGMAFVYPPTGAEQNLSDMLKAESAARAAKRGIWADPFYADLDGNKGSVTYGRFAFVRGNVVKAERVKNKFYLNFGPDWRKDFTVAIAAHDLHAWKKAKIDPESYAGKNVRVRGWVKRDFGPMIMVTSPDQIELLP